MPKHALNECSSCGGESLILYVRQRVDGGVFRRRRCLACDVRFSTEETIIGGQRSENSVSVSMLVEALESVGIAVDVSDVGLLNRMKP